MNHKELIDLFDDVETADTMMLKVRDHFISKRKQLKMTQRQLSDASGVSYASLRRFETTGEISFCSLLSLAEKLNCLDEFASLFPLKRVRDLKEDFENE